MEQFLILLHAIKIPVLMDINGVFQIKNAFKNKFVFRKLLIKTYKFINANFVIQFQMCPTVIIIVAQVPNTIQQKMDHAMSIVQMEKLHKVIHNAIHRMYNVLMDINQIHRINVRKLFALLKFLLLIIFQHFYSNVQIVVLLKVSIIARIPVYLVQNYNIIICSNNNVWYIVVMELSHLIKKVVLHQIYVWIEHNGAIKKNNVKQVIVKALQHKFLHNY
ncbi:transmembrane protein, putative (macronuclear) [Tetrahymena thermophila SB210]|uniref:Transmembrane protein, putative n=1 Tax=Tetrahymena thermophila (strain SB210) TaxID=312017 RepID=W7XH91_TETTS|nr:transmembrane protein, putative [Tetrahymena thermophila SB210]EWS73711.1 transmembrane protein, putative [Tetrahymena thermophila SB210]|eukprot:XP_012653749.1 transmembrane protein, putative [Tetrahymena thermophila SB210]